MAAKRATPPSAVLDLRIDRPAAGGAMIARHVGRIVLVAGAIPGERVRAVVVRELRDVIFATVIEVVEPHADRREVRGDPACGGQVYAHIAYDRQRALKGELIADALTRLARLAWTTPIPVAPSPEQGYRMRARLHARAERIGFLREGTHRVCDAAQTRQLLPETADVLADVGRRLAAARSGHTREIELAENVAGDERVLHLHVGRGAGTGPIAALGRCPGVTGVTVAGPDGRVRSVAGAPRVADPLAVIAPLAPASVATALSRRAASFFQANRFLLPRMVSAVCQQVREGPVLDLYAGVGPFGVSLAALGAGPITAVEGDAVAADDLGANARPFDSSLRPVHASVEAYLSANPRPAVETVIVDPPRTGLTRPVVERLAAAGTPRIVYVGCDVATWARDVGRLAQAGYTLGHLEAFDFFPNTAHVEILATLDKE